MEKNNQVGGVVITTGDPNTAFAAFLANCTIDYLSSGTSGCLFLLKYTGTGTNTSPYLSSNPFTWGQPVTRIVVKFNAISTSKRNWYYDQFNRSLFKQMETAPNFVRETLYQADAFLETAIRLQQITPSPLYSEMLTDHDYVSTMLTDLLSKVDRADTGETRDWLLCFMDGFLNHPHFTALGLLAMELADGFEQLYSLSSSPHYQLCMGMARCQIVNMAIKTGYVHLDFHQKNIMVKLGADGIPIDVFIIDFGRIVKLTRGQMDDLRGHLAEFSYQELVNEFKQHDYDGVRMGQWARNGYVGYEWLWSGALHMVEGFEQLESLKQHKEALVLDIGEDEFRGGIEHFFSAGATFDQVATTPRSRLALDSVRRRRDYRHPEDTRPSAATAATSSKRSAKKKTAKAGARGVAGTGTGTAGTGVAVTEAPDVVIRRSTRKKSSA